MTEQRFMQPESQVWRRPTSWAFVAAVLLAAAIPSIVEPYRIYLATLVGIYIITAVGLNVVMGYSGQISIAQGAFMGVGAYTTALLMDRFDVPLLLAMLASTALAGSLGFVVGLPALRIAGHYLALATLAFQIIIERAIFNWDSLTNGPRGLSVPRVTLFGWEMRGAALYWLVLVVAVITVLFVRNVVKSRVGRAWRALRDQQLAAVVFGISASRYKTMAFAVSAAYGGLAGSLFAVTLGYLDPLAFNLWESVKQLTMVIFGGLGTLTGPVLGAGILESLPAFLTSFEERSLLIYFVLLLVVLLFFPGGLVDGARRLGVWAGFWTGLLSSRLRGAAPVGAQHAAASAVTPETMQVLPQFVGASTVDRGEPLLEGSQITVQFGGLVALEKVDLTVRRGEIKGLIGPNGAGKTTLFNVLTRVYGQTEGTVTFDAHDLAGSRRHQLATLGISRTFQNVAMFTSMTVLENVMVGGHHLRAMGFWRNGVRTPGSIREERAARAEAMEVLSFLNLDRYAHTMAEVLPIGLQRRVEIARALASRPSLLLLDEPASGLTASEATRLMEDIRLLREAGLTVLVIEHNIRFVMGLVDSVSVLDRGRLIFDGVPADAQVDPGVVTAYLGTDDDTASEGEDLDELRA